MPGASALRFLLVVLAAGVFGGASAAAAPPWRAFGNEPFWSLTRTAEKLTLEIDLGKTRVSIPTPRPTPSGSRETRYIGSAKGTPLVVTLRQEVCVDTMTGMPRPEQVTVAYAGRTLKGCGGDPASLLTGREWTVATLAGRPTLPEPRITMTFADGRVSGLGSCNRYGAEYSTGEGLTFSKGMSTMMACPSAIMDQEQAFLGLLEKITRFSISPGGALVLEADDRRTIAMEKPK